MREHRPFIFAFVGFAALFIIHWVSDPGEERLYKEKATICEEIEYAFQWRDGELK